MADLPKSATSSAGASQSAVAVPHRVRDLTHGGEVSHTVVVQLNSEVTQTPVVVQAVLTRTTYGRTATSDAEAAHTASGAVVKITSGAAEASHTASIDIDKNPSNTVGASQGVATVHLKNVAPSHAVVSQTIVANVISGQVPSHTVEAFQQALGVVY